MHRPRHLHTVVSMRVASALAMLSGLFFLASVALAGYALIDIDRPLLLGSLGLFFLFLGSLLGYRILAASARCPLCMGPVLLSRQCSRNKNATTFLGSFRLRVARDILIRKSFRCPYCGEPTKCEARESRQPLPQEADEHHKRSTSPSSW